MTDSPTEAPPGAPAPALQTASVDALEARLGYRFRRPELLVQALTHPSFVNEQAGAASADNQRLEFLGDAVVQLVVSEVLMQAFPTEPEGRLTRQRARIVRREGLLVAAEALGLGAHLLLGRGEEQSGGRTKPSVLADAFEALAGALFVDAGFGVAAPVLRALLEPLLQRSELDRRVVDAKSRLQEITQGVYGCSPVYELRATEGPEHAKRFVVRALLAGRPWGNGVGGSKKAAAQAAAAQVLERLEAGRDGSRWPPLERPPEDAQGEPAAT